MIKVCNRAPNPIQVGNITIPGFSSVLLNSFSSTMETNRLMNKGLLSVYYIPNEVENTSTNAVNNDNSVTENNVENIINETVTTEINNIITEENVTEESIKPRKRGRSKSTVEDSTETNIMKGDIEYASDND